MQKILYFDANANYPPSLEIIKEYNLGLQEHNISSAISNETRNIVQTVIDKILKYHQGNVSPDNYIFMFTSGGSESNSTVLNNYLYNSAKNNYSMNFICSISEHSSVIEKLRQFEKDKLAHVTWIGIDWAGRVNLEELFAAIRPNIDCVFCQSCNSETGSVQPIIEIQDYIETYNSEHGCNIQLAVDNVQGFMKYEYPANIGDFISLSFHKIGVPIGLGGLLIRKNIKFYPTIAGKQNKGNRGGTYNIAGIRSLLVAMNTYNYKKCCSKFAVFASELSQKFQLVKYPDYQPNKLGLVAILFRDPPSLEHVIYMSISVNGKILCGTMVKNALKDQFNTIIGTGSACNTGNVPTSGMGVSPVSDQVKKGFIRISFSDNSNNEIKKLSKYLTKIAEHFL